MSKLALSSTMARRNNGDAGGLRERTMRERRVLSAILLATARIGGPP
jgi:hypothetical protein